MLNAVIVYALISLSGLWLFLYTETRLKFNNIYLSEFLVILLAIIVPVINVAFLLVSICNFLSASKVSSKIVFRAVSGEKDEDESE